jgi:hypothetical protein
MWMRLFRHLLIVAGLVASLAPGAALADAGHGVFNKEHVWAIDVDGGACAVSRTLDDGSVFLFRAQDGDLTFGFFPQTPLKPARTGRIETEAYGFDFAPSVGRGGETLFLDGAFNARAVAALRLARRVKVLTDGKVAVAMTFEGTGFEEALDGVIACSEGASGWWGPGVAPTDTDTGPRPDKPADGLVFNKEGAWAIAVSEEPGVCVAEARASDHLAIQILAYRGTTGLAVSAERALPKGSQGRLQTDGYAFDFTPQYGGRRYLTAKQPFDVAAIQALYRAKWLRVSIDKRQLLDIDLTDTGFADLLDAVAACSQGRKGWWGAGAKPGP